MEAPALLPSDSGTLRRLLWLAAPVLAEELLNMLVGFTDLWLTGRYFQGDAFSSAIGCVNYSLWMVLCMFSLAGIGATALIARSIGGGNLDLARRTVHQALLLGGAIAALMTVAAVFGARSFVALLQLPPDAAENALIYFRWMIPAIPILMFEQVGTACLRGAGDTVTGLKARVVVNVVNILLSTSLVIGWSPLPVIGWEGLAIAAACGHAMGGILILAALVSGRAGLKLQGALFRPDAALLRRLLRVSLPGGCDVLAVVACHMVYFSIVNRVGEVASAAHALGVQIEAIAYLPGVAFSVAVAALTGQALGAHQPARASRTVVMACCLAGGIMCCSGLAMFFGGSYLAWFFTDSFTSPRSQLAALYLAIVAVSMPSLAVTSVLSGALRGAGDTRITLLITFAGLIGIRLPLAAFLALPEIDLPFVGRIAGCDWGVTGAWYGMVIDVVFRSFLLFGRFVHGGWKTVRV